MKKTVSIIGIVLLLIISMLGFQYLVIYIPTNLYFYLFPQSIQNFSSTYLYTSLHTICFD